MAVIFYISAQTNPLPTVTAHVWDKLLHIVEYAGLALLFARAVAGEGIPWPTAVFLAGVLASAYAATDEYHQAFVAMRSSDFLDWLADALGAAAGAMAFAFTQNGMARSTQNQ
jgi:VanZ family protein